VNEQETRQDDRPFGVRQLLAEVNLRDFSRMVLGELALVSSSVRQAFEQKRRFLLPLVLLAAFVRLVLLVLVVVVLGGAILVVTVVRGAARLMGRRPAPSQPG
jgi:hypothetical protein